ncbi:MAG: hypothetical protein EOP39_24685, partial [Rubrivivax sp.]
MMQPLQRAPAGPPGTLSYSLQYADATYDGYRAKLREELERSSQLGQGLLTLGTLAMGAAIGHAHRDVLITAALGGGLAYQLGTWNQNSDRLDIYLEGMKAMACAKAAVAPLRMSPAARKEIVDAEKEVALATVPVANALAATVRWLNVAMASQTPNSETAQAARAEIAETAALFTRLNELHQRAASLRQNADGAGAMLEARIDEMRRQIDAAIKARQASLASLPQQISAIASYANTIVPGLKLETAFQGSIATLNESLAARQKSTAQNAKDEKPDKARDAAPAPLEPRDQLATALGNLQASRALLAIPAAKLAGASDRATNRVKDDLAGCNVYATKLAASMRLTRTQIEFTAGQSRQSRVQIVGGTQPFTAVAMDMPMPGLLPVVQAGASEVLVIADTTTVAGSTYQINVQDAAQNSALLTLRVLPAAAAAPTTPAARECTGDGWSNRTLVCVVQHATGAKRTGTKDAGTCEAFIKAFPDSRGVLDDAGRAAVLAAEKFEAKAQDADMRKVLSSAEVKACGLSSDTSERLRTPAAVTPGARTAFEKRLGPDEIRIISKGLEMNPPVSELGDEFRRGLGSYQKRHGLADTKGTLPRP